MKKISKILLVVILLLVVKYILSETLVLARGIGNKESFMYSSNVVHSTDNCKVVKYHINNTKAVDGNVYCITIFKNKMNYKVTKNPYENNFYINSNFFSNGPIGEVVIDGKTINRRRPGGGFFTSNGGNFDISFYSRPKGVKYSSQTHLIGVKNGKLNNSIMKQSWSKAQFYRIIVGKDKYGNLMVLHSDRNALISIKTISLIAIDNGMVDGLVFDGGSSVDVGVNDNGYNHEFKSLPDLIKTFGGIKQPPVYISGNFK